MDMFELFGVEAIETPKKETKKADKKDKAKKTAPEKKDKQKMMLPLTVYTGFNNPFKITGEGEITDERLRSRIFGVTKEFHPDYLTYELIGDKVWVSFDESKETSKGKVKISDDSKMYLASHTLDLTEVCVDENEMADITAIQEVLKKVHPAMKKIGVVVSKDGKTMAPVFHGEELGKTELSFPIRITLYGRKNYQITKEEYVNFLKEKGVDDGVFRFDAGCLIDMITKTYPEFDQKHTKLVYLKQENIVVPVLRVQKPKSSLAPKKKEEMYPTEDTTLSFIFEKIPLSPEMFDGKKQVSKKELLAYCAERFPEYASESASIYYDKKLKILFPRIEGSKKGAKGVELVTDPAEYAARIKDGYALFRYQLEHLYRVESTPVSLTVASMDGADTGWYEYRLPKIPMSVFVAIFGFFQMIAEELQSEVLVRIYYDPQNKKYLLEVPEQHVGPGHVITKIPVRMDIWPVMDIHSHCTYPAFFSPVDDGDEKGNRLYAVIGSVNSSHPKFLLRAGTGGYYVNLETSKHVFCGLDETDWDAMLLEQKENVKRGF